MQNNVHGVPAGVLKTMHVTTYFHVALRLLENFMLALDVVAPGAGNVEKNTVLSIMIRVRVRDFLQQKILMMRRVARRNKDISGMTIALEDIVGIVP